MTAESGCLREPPHTRTPTYVQHIIIIMKIKCREGDQAGRYYHCPSNPLAHDPCPFSGGSICIFPYTFSKASEQRFSNFVARQQQLNDKAQTSTEKKKKTGSSRVADKGKLAGVTGAGEVVGGLPPLDLAPLASPAAAASVDSERFVRV